MFRARVVIPCGAERFHAQRTHPQQTGVVSEQPPSKQVGISAVSALLFAVLSAAPPARPPSNVGRSLRQGDAHRPSLDSTVAFNIGGRPWPVERIGSGTKKFQFVLREVVPVLCLTCLLKAYVFLASVGFPSRKDPVMEKTGLTSFTKRAAARPLPTDAQSRCARQACPIAA